MKCTLDLLTQAKAQFAPISERALSQQLGHSPTALTTARQRGSLSPIIAGQLAERLGFDPVPWMALAVTETEKKSRTVDALRRRAMLALNS
jgi:hypothetical protein